MAEAQRLTMWGWFVRAFAGGFGVVFGVMTALAVVCVFCYAVVAAGAMALTSIGGVTINPASSTTTIPWATSTTQIPAAAQAYQAPVEAQPYQSPAYEARALQPYSNTGPYGNTEPDESIQALPAIYDAAAESEPAGIQPGIPDASIGAYPAIYDAAIESEPTVVQPSTIESEPAEVQPARIESEPAEIQPATNAE